MTQDELKKAFRYWFVSSPVFEIDESLGPFLSDKIKPFNSIGEEQWKDQDSGWLKKARQSLFLSAETVAKKLNVSRAAYSKYEECELRGAVTLETLARAAEAMDCELVYAIRPKNKKYFSTLIWEAVLPVAKLHSWVKKCDPRRKPQALVFIANKYINNSQFRKKQGWSQRATKKITTTD